MAASWRPGPRHPGARRGAAMGTLGWIAVTASVIVASGCGADRFERGVFYSAKGYHVTLPPGGWGVASRGEADLELRRRDLPGGMAVSANCEGVTFRRPLSLLARHLTFGLDERQLLESSTTVVGGAPAARRLLRGWLDGQEVMVEAVVTKDARCVYDFLYVSPPDHFEAGRDAFGVLLESFGTGGTAP
jgi:hypothetical protein